MGFSISITTSNEVLSEKLDLAELSLLKEQADVRGVSEAYDQFFGLGKRRVELNALYHAATKLSDASKTITPRELFSFSGTAGGFPFSGVRRVGGIKIGSEYFSLLGGLDRCMMRLMIEGDDGKTLVASETDIRNREFVDSDNLGRVLIKRVSKPIQILRFMNESLRLLSPRNGLANIDVS